MKTTLFFANVLSFVKHNCNRRVFGCSVNLTDKLVPRVKSRSSKLKFKTWLRADKQGREKPHERIKYFVRWWLQSCKSFGQCVVRVVPAVVLWECEFDRPGVEMYIIWKASSFDLLTHLIQITRKDWGPLNYWTVLVPLTVRGEWFSSHRLRWCPVS